MQDNMSQEDVGKVEAFIQNEEPCDFCTLSEECPKGMRCYGGEPIEPACTDLSDHFVEDVKKMDHQQMDQFCQNLYKAGHADGMKDAEGLTESEVRDVILGVKGIGPKKAEDIVKALTEAQKERS